MKQPVTKAIVGLNIVAYIYVYFFLQGTQGSPAVLEFINRFALTPSEFRDGAFWQPITAVFLHGGIVHLLFNMIGIWSLGEALENTIGSLRYAWLCFVSAATGSLFVILLQPDLEHPSLGASGMLLGLLGALAVFYPNSPLLVFFFPMRARTAAIAVGVLSILLPIFGLFESISHMAHLGGLLGGVLYSRFALGLRFGTNDLRDSGGSFQRKIMQQNMLRGMFERINRVPPDRWRDRDEKVINPIDGDQPDAAGKKLYYDPSTGKFYLR
jgi:membrane associated rhomboid family serine protease